MIHLEDCIGIIQKIIESNIWEETFNAAAPFHPIRKAYYTQKAIELNLDAAAYLNNNDAYHFFKQIDGLLFTGPTNTNVMDLLIILRHP